MTTLVIITGASKGIGRSIAIAFSKDKRIEKLSICLIARNREGLIQTQALIKNGTSPRNREVKSTIHSIDLGNLQTLQSNIEIIFREKMLESKYERAIFINNAGSLGYIGPSSKMPSPTELEKNVNFNITSSLWLSSNFVNFFAKKNFIKSYVVNISSLCAISPFKTMAMYCSGKAARDIWHKTLALEENGALVKVLNYAPGVVKTDMTQSLTDSATLDSELSTFYNKSKIEKTYIQPEATGQKLVNILLEDKYCTGDHIDYWDYQ